MYTKYVQCIQNMFFVYTICAMYKICSGCATRTKMRKICSRSAGVHACTWARVYCSSYTMYCSGFPYTLCIVPVVQVSVPAPGHTRQHENSAQRFSQVYSWLWLGYAGVLIPAIPALYILIPAIPALYTRPVPSKSIPGFGWGMQVRVY